MPSVRLCFCLLASAFCLSLVSPLQRPKPLPIRAVDLPDTLAVADFRQEPQARRVVGEAVAKSAVEVLEPALRFEIQAEVPRVGVVESLPLAAEIVGGDGKAVLAGRAEVLNRKGVNVTPHFIDGAQKALATARMKECKLAILTENSHSCGSSWICDGSFSGVKLPGQGVTAALLEQHGIRVFNQYQIEQVLFHLERL